MSERESVKVCVRCRPFSEKERNEGHSNVVAINSEQGSVAIQANNSETPKTFTFDSVFDEQSMQMQVYNSIAKPIVDCVLNGYNVDKREPERRSAVRAVYSVEGVRDDINLRGIIPNSFVQIFDHIKRNATNTTKFLVRASFLEIYNEEIYDLLSKSDRKLDLKERPETGVYVKDLSTFVVKSVDEMEKLMAVGNKNRAVGATLMNARSSRSHSIFTITIETSELSSLDQKDHFKVGKLNLVDLAGSERQGKTGATGERLKEATKINLSLSALGNVISSLVDGKSTHIPYRDSKLTRLLQDSLGGNSKTTMIATLSPASYNYEETLSTLKYANRAKNIKNKPKVNEDPKDTLLREYQEEIRKLKEQLQKENPDGSSSERKSIKKRSKSAISRSKGDDVGSEAGEDDLEQMEQEYIKLEKERKAVLESKEMLEEEKVELLNQLDRRKEEMDREKKEREEIAQRLKEMEEKLLFGGVNILDEAEKQEMELQKREIELQRQLERENALKRELESHEEVQLQIEEEFTSLQDEAAAKTKKLKQLFAYFQKLKVELQDRIEEEEQEVEDLLDTLGELNYQLDLKNLIVYACVPEKALMDIESHSEYDPVTETWRIAHIAHAGNNIKGKRSVITGSPIEGLRRKIADQPQQIKNDTNIAIEEWMGYSANPLWSTSGGFLMYSKVVPEAFNEIMNEDQENKVSKVNRRVKSAKKPQVKKSQEVKDEVLPTARGLIQKPKRYA